MAMAMTIEKPPYARIESTHDSTPATVVPPPRTLRHKVSRALSILALARRDPGSPERERRPVPPLPTPVALSPSTAPAPKTETETDRETAKERGPLKRTWGRSVAIARTRSEPALRAKRAKAAAAALLPPVPAVPSRSAPPLVTTHSRDVNAYVPARGRERDGEGAVVAYTYPLWRIDPVLVGCFVCL